MADEDLSLFPVTYAVPERIPKHEVDAYIAAHPDLELNLLPFETAREKVAAFYFLENERRLKQATLDERDKYHVALELLEKRVNKEKSGEDVNRVNYRKRKDELTGAMQGPLTLVGAQIIEQQAKALIEMDRLLSIEEHKEERKAHQKELGDFLRNSVQEYREEEKKKEEEYREFVRNSVKKFIEDNRE